MALLASVFLPFLASALLTIASAFWWREELSRPSLYCVLSFLVLLGLSHLIHSSVGLAKDLWPVGEGYFIVAKVTPQEIEVIERALAVQSLAIAIVVALLSIPLLAALKDGFVK